MTAKMKSLMIAGAAVIALAACSSGDSASSSGARSDQGGLTGRYVSEVPVSGMTMEVEFRKDGESVLTFVEGANRSDMDCTYQSGERRIALSCFGSSGISLTRLDGGDLEGDIDGTIVRFKKR